jgi:hypothetical protein
MAVDEITAIDSDGHRGRRSRLNISDRGGMKFSGSVRRDLTGC